MLYCSVGSVLSEVEKPARVCTIIQARVLVFDIEFPITQGYPVSDVYTLQYITTYLCTHT